MRMNNDEKITKLEIKKGSRVFSLNIKSLNKPSSEAIESCNRLVNTVMNRLLTA